MTIRDIQCSFTDSTTGSTATFVGAAGTTLAPNSIDTGPLGGFFTENTANDTQLTANTNPYRELGGGERIWLIVDIIQAAAGGTSVDFQLITSAAVGLGTPTVMIDFGVIATAGLTAGTRLIQALPRSTKWLQWLGLQTITLGTYTGGTYVAWLGKDVDAVLLGAASGYSIK